MKIPSQLRTSGAGFWPAFAALAAIPRCSGQEKAVLDFIKTQAEAAGLAWKQDKTGNLAVQVPASPGRENRPVAVLQGHVDMVCEKNRDKTHDFSCQGIDLVVDGDWLKADGTTLGADNGIAVAYMLDLFTTKEPAHGPLECLFTVDEETALTGALQLDPALLTGKLLINLDSEDEGVFTIGCAGGVNTTGQVPLDWQADSRTPWQLALTGLPGGHSGVNIHEGRGNALKLLASLLLDFRQQAKTWTLTNFEGGDKHNALPREAFASLCLDSADLELLKKSLPLWQEQIRQEMPQHGRLARLELTAAAGTGKALTAAATDKLLRTLAALPHGPMTMSPLVPGLVETSTNLAAVKFKDGNLQVLTSQRSSRRSLQDAVSRSVAAVLALAGGTSHTGDGYPAWTPRADSPLLEHCKALWKKRTGKDPVVEVIHAGLECGVIGDKIPGMDMISLGPDLREVHTPGEKLSIASAERVRAFLGELLASL